VKKLLLNISTRECFSVYLDMRAYRRLRVQLTKQDEKELLGLLQGGIQRVRVVLRALALLQLSVGQTAGKVAKNVALTSKAVREIGRRYGEGGLERALYEKQRPGAAPTLDPSHRQRIIAMVCADPPAGYARWTVRLIAAEAVKRKLVPRVGRETIRILLESHDLKPWREKNVVRGGTQSRVHRKDGRRTGGV
jgi:putative transposase